MLLLLVVGCKNSEDPCAKDPTGPGCAGQIAAIAITISKSALTIQQGKSDSLRATITRSGGFTGAVTIVTEGVPAGVTGSVSDVSTSNGVTSGTVVLAVAGSVTPGNYNLTVRASGSGVPDQTVAATLTVTAVPSINLTLSPTSLSLTQGANGSTTVTIARTNFTGTVNLSLEGAPAGMTGVFVPAAAPGDNSTLTVTVGGAVAAANYSLTVRGTASGLTDKTTALTVVVTPSSAVVLQGGPGSGRIQVEAAGGQAALDCVVTSGTTSGSCQRSYPNGTPLTVTATATPPSVFGGWAQGCQGTVNPCQYQVAGGGVIKASFQTPVTQFKLSVLAGAGSVAGVITSSPAGIACTISATGQTSANGCEAFFDNATVVTLTPSGPNPLQSWGSACINVPATSTCPVTMGSDQAVVATFALVPQPQVVSSLKRGAIGALDPPTIFNFPIVNAGGGDLRINRDPVNIELNRGSGWITATVQYGDPSSSTLELNVIPEKLRPFSRTDFTARITLKDTNTGQTFDLNFSVRPLINTSPVLANGVVYFHYEPVRPLPELKTLVPFVGKNSQPVAASLVTFDVGFSTWIKDVTVNGSSIELLTQAVDFDQVTPDGNNNEAVTVKVKTPTDKCDRINPADNKSCTILAYYTRDQLPRMELDPWGLVFTPSNPGPLDAIIKAFNPQLGRLRPGARIKSDDCGPWVTSKTIVAGSPEHFRAEVNFAAVPTDTSFSCNVVVQADMEELDGTPINGPTERNLEITATRPPADAVTPEYPDLSLVTAAAPFERSVLIYNFGTGKLDLASVTPDRGSCPAGLLSARRNPVRLVRLTDDLKNTAQVLVKIDRTGVPAGTTCSGSVTVTVNTGALAVIPVAVKVP